MVEFAFVYKFMEFYEEVTEVHSFSNHTHRVPWGFFYDVYNTSYMVEPVFMHHIYYYYYLGNSFQITMFPLS